MPDRRGMEIQGTEIIPDSGRCNASPRTVPPEREFGQQPNVLMEEATSSGGSDEGFTSTTTAETRSSTPPAAGLLGGCRSPSGKAQVPISVTSQFTPVESSVPMVRKEEIEGSRPRAYKPSIRLQAPPGGGSSFNSDWSGGYMSGPKVGKKFIPGAGGAGANRDARTIEALRFFTDHDDAVGKLKVQAGPHWAEKSALDEQRYYLSAEGVTDRMPGKASRCSDSGVSDGYMHPRATGLRTRTAGQGYGSERGYDEKPLPGSSDSLPLGAEWHSWESGADCRCIP